MLIKNLRQRDKSRGTIAKGSPDEMGIHAQRPLGHYTKRTSKRTVKRGLHVGTSQMGIIEDTSGQRDKAKQAKYAR